MPSLCATPQRLGDPRVVPCFRWLFSVGMSPSETPGSRSVAYTQFLHRPRWPSTFWDGLGTSLTLHPPIPVEESISGLNYGSLALQPADLLAPCRSRPCFRSAYGDFYIRASGGLVTRTAAGYDYSGNWASSTDGTYYFAPARTPTSIAATQNQTRHVLSCRMCHPNVEKANPKR